MELVAFWGNRKMKRLLRLLIAGLAGMMSSPAVADVIGGIDFPKSFGGFELRSVIDNEKANPRFGVTQVLQKILKQPVIVQDSPGGGGTLILGRGKTVKPDGYTLLQTSFPMYSHQLHLRVFLYDPLKASLTSPCMSGFNTSSKYLRTVPG